MMNRINHGNVSPSSSGFLLEINGSLGEPTKSKMSHTPTKADVTPPKPLSPKLPMRRGFRFSAEQRAVLEAQVANHGPYPDSDRRAALARDLGVEEKTIRVLETQLASDSITN